MPLKHGFLIIDKPISISSAYAVDKVKKVLKCKKIGHGGTLDPLASGVLPLAIGEATKAISYIVNATKEYEFTISFGEERGTGDAGGVVTETTNITPKYEEILAVLPEFTGDIMQTPPAFSAIKVDGKRAYGLARSGLIPEMSARPVQVYELKPIAHSENTMTLAVRCGKGVYVRSLAQDIARKCGSLGFVSMLRRVAVGKFASKDAILLDNLRDLVHKGELQKYWIPIETALDDISALNLESDQMLALRLGRAINMNVLDGTYMALHNGKIVALVEQKSGVLRSLRVFNI